MGRLDSFTADALTDHELALEITRLEHQWDNLFAALEESGGCSGSPGEWLTERLTELDSERRKRAPTPAATSHG